MNTFQKAENKLVRESIFEALLTLLNDKDLRQISISEITAKAGVSRMAYYRNFKSKEEIFTTYLDDLFSTYKEQVLIQRNNLTHASTLFFTFFRQYKTALKHFHHTPLMFLMAARFSDYTQHLLKEFDPINPLPDKEMHYTLSFISGGILNLLTTWIEDDLNETDIEMGQRLATLLQAVLKSNQ